jgi:hypothetical protein
MEQALGAGKTVTVLHVSRPLEEMFAAMLDRAELQGRVVTIEQLLDSHRGSAQAVCDLLREYAHDLSVRFLFVDNSARGTREGTIELALPQDYTEIRKRLYELLHAEYQTGRITEAIYGRIRGRD